MSSLNAPAKNPTAIKATGALRGGWFEGRPLFVVEVVSPSDRRSRRLQKVGLYLEAGAGAVVKIDYTKRILWCIRRKPMLPN